MRHLDLAVLALALPVFVLASLSLVAYVATALVWLVQRWIGSVVERRAEAADDAKAVVALLAGGSMGRAWLTALGILAIGLTLDERAGLAAAVLILALFTTYFTSRLILRGIAA